MSSLPKVFITNWGSGIYWFQQFPKHKRRIVQLLDIASFYSAECQRDIEIVKKLGYASKTMPVIPNSAGINLDELPNNSLPPSQRRKIMINGYTGFVGQALLAIKACELAAEQLRGYEIVIYSASVKSMIKALKLRHIHNVQVTILKKRTPHSEMLQRFSEARIYIGISLSDGISTSLLEAMATGCYPIQTSTSCAAEWISDKSGSVTPADPNLVCEKLIQALVLDKLVEEAALINMHTMQTDCESLRIGQKSISFYLSIFSQLR